MDPPDAAIVAHTIVRKAALEELRALYNTLFAINGVPEEYIAKSVDDATRQMENMATHSIKLCIAGYVYTMPRDTPCGTRHSALTDVATTRLLLQYAAPYLRYSVPRHTRIRSHDASPWRDTYTVAAVHLLVIQNIYHRTLVCSII